MRDALEQADHDLWASMLCDEDESAALKRYTAAARRASALGFAYRPAAELEAKASWQELSERMEAILDVRTPHARWGPREAAPEIMEAFLFLSCLGQLALETPQDRRKSGAVLTGAVDHQR
ncbi:hypothetical protein [Microvirga brassicacearum]|nr:hypothetical protein [Microvirga brassicacearum]